MDLRIEELAELLSVSQTKILGWVQEGSIPSYCIHDEYRFNRSEIEDWIVRNPINKLVDAKDIEHFSEDGSLRYSLYKAIYRGGALYDIEGNNKQEVIKSVAQYVANRYDLDANVLYELLINREKMMSTGIGEGIAVPHIKDFVFKNYYDVVVPVFLSTPIDFHSLDGKRVSVLFFVFAENDRSHLNLINKIVNLGVSSEARNFLYARPSCLNLLAYIKAWEANTR